MCYIFRKCEHIVAFQNIKCECVILTISLGSYRLKIDIISWVLKLNEIYYQVFLYRRNDQYRDALGAYTHNIYIYTYVYIHTLSLFGDLGSCIDVGFVLKNKYMTSTKPQLGKTPS